MLGFRIVDRNHQAHFYFTQNEADRDAWIKLIRRVIQGAGFQVLSADEEELARKRLEDKARKQLPTGLFSHFIVFLFLFDFKSKLFVLLFSCKIGCFI